MLSMRKCFILLFLPLLLISTKSYPTENLRIATYNVLNPVFEQKHKEGSTWPSRFPHVVETVIASNSDLICMEEVNIACYNQLAQDQKLNKIYSSFYVAHGNSKPEYPEGRDGLAFFFKKGKIAIDNIQISSDSSRPTHRRDYYVDFQWQGKNLRVAGIHVDADRVNTELGNKQVVAMVQDILNPAQLRKTDLVVVCGDFNEGHDETERPRFDSMTRAGFITDGSTASTRPEAIKTNHKGHVDWIFFKPVSEMGFRLVAIDPIGDEKASDHKLTMTDVQID